MNRLRNARWPAALAIFLMARPDLLHAQSCALCYQSAAASGSLFIQALRSGILILLFPPLLIAAAVGVAAYRKRNSFHTNDEGRRVVQATGKARRDDPTAPISLDPAALRGAVAAIHGEREIFSDTCA